MRDPRPLDIGCDFDQALSNLVSHRQVSSNGNKGFSMKVLDWKEGRHYRGCFNHKLLSYVALLYLHLELEVVLSHLSE